MPIIQINFPNVLNVSVQVGDIAYFLNPAEVGDTQIQNPLASTTTPHMTGPQAGIIKIGEIIGLDCCTNSNIPSTGGHIVCDMPQDLFNLYYGSGCDTGYCLCNRTLTQITCKVNSYIMFSKDNKANMSSMLGYYASAQFRNNSTDEAELFNVGVDVFESSK
jgi:hypothetical protein